MSRGKDIFEHLVRQTVHTVLFSDTSDQHHESANDSVVIVGRSDTEQNAVETATAMEIRSDTLLHRLIHNYDNHTENSSEDERGNNADVISCTAWMKDCLNWSIERLKTEKALIKQYVQEHRRKRAEDCHKSPEMPADNFTIHEAYALLKLFLLERDPDYRQCLLQSIECDNSFLPSLHVQLTLYAAYFERTNGRPISLKTDVEPIQTLYEFFLAHHCASE
ncbi:hypothetical protein KRP22_010192 [Phytophthora ramorum]|uniref:uncharacterized protein n=1 Tax=Phytophthora ramorum TaxID=164328 RepID=UPI0030B02583|nr:hypothetical protein KRP23_6558 [Phytophthora ramorum]KAH7505467.1 hypothetical protein KRP22_5939 [Phytophthora ramorum]